MSKNIKKLSLPEILKLIFEAENPLEVIKEYQQDLGSAKNILEKISKRIANLEKQKQTLRTTLHNSQLDFENKVAEFSFIKELLEKLSIWQDLPEICQEAVKLVVKETRALNCSLMILDNETGFLRLRAAFGEQDQEPIYFPEEKAPNSFRLGQGIAGLAVSQKKPFLVLDVEVDPEFYLLPEGSSVPIRSLICVPLQVETDLVGVLNLSHSKPNHFTVEHQRLLSIIGQQLALALSKAKTQTDQAYQKNFLEKLVASTGQAIVALDLSGKILTFNRAAEIITGYLAKEAIGQFVGLLFADRRIPRRVLKNLLVQAHKPESIINIEHNIMNHNGQSVPLRITVGFILDKQNRRQAIVATGMDLTEIKNLQETLLSTEKVLTVAQTAITLNHEINNPLGVILLTSEYLLRNLTKLAPEEIQEKIKIISSSADTIRNITEKLSKLSVPVTTEYPGGQVMIDISQSITSGNYIYQVFQDRYARLLAEISDLTENTLNYRRGYTKMMIDFSLKLAQKLGFSEDECEKLKLICKLHDVGMMGIREDILNKPLTLNPKERAEVEIHPTLSERLVAPLPEAAETIRIVRHHHENFDGRGYPDRIRKNELPIVARLIRVVDAYIAMISDRPYRKALSQSVALAELERGAGTQFDPELVQEFVKIILQK